MPFGLDFKSLIAGAILGWFLVPWIMGMLSRGKTAPAAA